MRALCNSLPRNTSHTPRFLIEPLEGRRLLSWTTVDDFVPPPQGFGNYAQAEDMVPDGAGGVFAAGLAFDYSISQSLALVRHKDAVSSAWQTVATISTPYSGTTGTGTSGFREVAVAPTGEVYISGHLGGFPSKYVIWKGTLNAQGTALSLSVVDSQDVNLANGSVNPALVRNEDLAIDAGGNVFAVGRLTGKGGALGTSHWIVRKQTAGQGAFVTIDDYVFNKSDAWARGVTVVPSGPGAGVYVVGFGGGGNGNWGVYAGARWIVRKSTNGGSTWTNVDSFQAEPSTNAPSAASEIVAHEDGSLHVVGRVSTGVRTGGNNNFPTYRYDHRWYMRSSSDGGSSWSSHDVYPENVQAGVQPGGIGPALIVSPEGVVTDQAGKVYVAGTVNDNTVNSRSIVRTNADGGWSTSDDYQPAGGGSTRAYCMTRDSSGAVYVGGQAADHWSVRSMAPATMARSSLTSNSIFADSRITDVNRDKLEQLV